MDLSFTKLGKSITDRNKLLEKAIISTNKIDFDHDDAHIDNPSFINYLLKTSKPRQEIVNKAVGSTKYNVSQVVLSKAKIISTSLPKQEKIADFLSSIDGKIEIEKEILAKLKEIK